MIISASQFVHWRTARVLNIVHVQAGSAIVSGTRSNTTALLGLKDNLVMVYYCRFSMKEGPFDKAIWPSF